MKRQYGNLIACVLFAWQNLCFAEKDYSIEYPGADLANFPNSAFTLPTGKAYVEITPVNYSSQTTNGKSSQYNAGTLIRYGLLDDLELRFFSDVFSYSFDDSTSKGFGSQTFNLKWRIRDGTEGSSLPAIALEAALKTDLLKHNIHNDLLPSFSINFDQDLPFEIAFEYNIGFVTQTNAFAQMEAQLALSWAFQRELFDKISVFMHGYSNTASGATTSAIGGGLQWIPARMFTVFSNVNAGLTRATPGIFVVAGFALAF